MHSSESPSTADPFAPPPTFWQRHAEPIAVGVVFALTVVLTVMAFPPRPTPEFACAFAIPGAFWAYTRPRLKIFAWTMFAAQAVAWTILLGWLHNVTWGGLLLLGPFVGAWIGTWYLAAWWTLPRMVGRPTLVRLAAMLGLAGAWVLIEWSRTWLLGGFPWLPLAASQWERIAMLQIAAYGGAGCVSFVLIAVNLGFAAYAHRLFREGRSGLNKRSQEFFLALFLVLACFSIFIPETFNRHGFRQEFAKIRMIAFAKPAAGGTLPTGDALFRRLAQQRLRQRTCKLHFTDARLAIDQQGMRQCVAARQHFRQRRMMPRQDIVGHRETGRSADADAARSARWVASSA